MNRYFACKTSDVTAGDRCIVTVKGMELGIFLVNGQYTAWRNLCPHAAAPLCKGKITGTRLPSLVYEYEYGCEQQIIRCPWHGWEFDLTTGVHLADPETKLRGYPVEVDGEDIYVVMK